MLGRNNADGIDNRIDQPTTYLKLPTTQLFSSSLSFFTYFNNCTHFIPYLWPCRFPPNFGILSADNCLKNQVVGAAILEVGVR
jgi:hypothetical protein